MPAGQQEPGGSFGDLTPLLAPRSVAVIGASDREGNLGGLAVRFLGKFGYKGAVWPINPGRQTVGDRPCFADLAALPSIPDLAIVAVPADAVLGVLEECIAAKVPAAIVWAGGFAEVGAAGREKQRALEAVVRGSGLRLCGPNCIGVINTSIGLTASFSSLMTELDSFTPGSVSMVSQSGGTGVTAHGRAQELGLGFRLSISCGNEATLGIPEFIRALLHDDGTRVIAVYTEGLSDPPGFLDALAEARRRRKPVVVLKGGATEISSRAALAHTGRLAGMDRTYDAIFREFAAIRVYSMEEMLDVCLQLAALAEGQLPAGNRMLVSSFGGGAGVLGTDQCMREGLVVPPLASETRARVVPIMTPLGSSANPIDLTPGSVTNPKNRANLPAVLRTLIDDPGIDAMLFFGAGFSELAPNVAAMFNDLRHSSPKPVYLSWLSTPPGIREGLAEQGVIAFNEHARAVRAAGNIARYVENLSHRIVHRPELRRDFPWQDFVGPGMQVVSENVVAQILEAAGLAVAPGRLASTREDAVRVAREVGLPVAIKAISSGITHRAAWGLVALNIDTPEAVARTDRAFRARAAELGVALDGLWVQHMVAAGRELLVTALRDREFGVMVGCGMGGGETEIIDDAVFTRAPIDADAAADLLGRLRTLRRLPKLIAADRLAQAADFIARFSALVAGAPWESFTLEINPLKLGAEGAMAVDGLLLLK
jgi:acyl-CoA synthetase (NDP forming)